jgi:hypothetical protein
VAQAPTPSDCTQQMYMIINLAVGGTWPSYATGENGTMKVDYLCAFSGSSAISAIAVQTISPPEGGGKTPCGASSLKPTASSTQSASLASAVLNQHCHAGRRLPKRHAGLEQSGNRGPVRRAGSHQPIHPGPDWCKTARQAPLRRPRVMSGVGIPKLA